jgi:folate-binding protein YgfZ
VLSLSLHEFHRALGARFTSLNGAEAVADYGDAIAEHGALHETAGFLDLSFRSRLCLIGADRVRFLHGQVTNDVKALSPGEGCYTALVTAKGRMESDLNIYNLAEELLLDFEPGLGEFVSERLQKFIVADEVEVVNVAPLYGLLSVQGPAAAAAIGSLSWFESLPTNPFCFARHVDPHLGELYVANQARLGTSGFDLFVPQPAIGTLAEELLEAIRAVGGRACGWDAFETARIEAGIPRFGVDMDETNLPQEAGIEARAVSYTKGCYIGQEVLNRLHTLGHVNKELRGLRLPAKMKALPAKGDKLFYEGKEVGYITSATALPTLKSTVALGYVRREANQVGTELVVRTATLEAPAAVVAVPFSRRQGRKARTGKAGD